MTARWWLSIRIGVLGALTLCVLMLAGCYRHVVGTEGIGTGNEKIYEPNLKESDDGQSMNSKSVPTKTVPSKRAS